MTDLRRILLATDLEPKSDRAMERAVQLARQFGGDLAVLHVVCCDNGPYDHLPLHHVEAELRRHLFAVPGASGLAPQVAAIRGKAIGRQIAEYAEYWQPDLIIVGVHGRDSVADLFAASTIERIGIADRTPLLVVGGKPLGPYTSALVAVDFSEVSRQAIKAARILVMEGSIKLLHVFDGPVPAFAPLATITEAGFMDDFRELLVDLKVTNLIVGTEVRMGSPVQQILEAAKEGAYDLVVMGTARRNRLSRTLVGSTAHETLTSLPSDVLLVKAP